MSLIRLTFNLPIVTKLFIGRYTVGGGEGNEQVNEICILHEYHKTSSNNTQTQFYFCKKNDYFRKKLLFEKFLIRFSNI